MLPDFSLCAFIADLKRAAFALVRGRRRGPPIDQPTSSLTKRSSLRARKDRSTRPFSATNRFYSIATTYTPHGNFQRQVNWNDWLRSHGYVDPDPKVLTQWKRFHMATKSSFRRTSIRSNEDRHRQWCYFLERR